MTPNRLTLPLLILLFLLPVVPSSGLSWLGIDTGLILLINTDQDSAPSPLLNTLGVSIPFLGGDNPLYWEASLLFFNTHYQHSIGANGMDRFTPAEIEKADSLWTLGLILDTRFGYALKLGDTVRIGGAAGLAAVFRLPLIAIEQGGEYQGPAMSYFLTRFLYPELEIAVHWDILKSMGLAIAVRGLFPLFHIWDGENLPFFDQMMIMGNLEFRIFL